MPSTGKRTRENVPGCRAQPLAIDAGAGLGLNAGRRRRARPMPGDTRARARALKRAKKTVPRTARRRGRYGASLHLLRDIAGPLLRTTEIALPKLRVVHLRHAPGEALPSLLPLAHEELRPMPWTVRLLFSTAETHGKKGTAQGSPMKASMVRRSRGSEPRAVRRRCAASTHSARDGATGGCGCPFSSSG